MPGIRLNISKSGTSFSFGGRGATLNVSSKGSSATVGIPGTGLFYRTHLSSSRAKKAAASASPYQNSAQGLVSYPGHPPTGRRFSSGRALGVLALIGFGVWLLPNQKPPPERATTPNAAAVSDPTTVVHPVTEALVGRLVENHTQQSQQQALETAPSPLSWSAAVGTPPRQNIHVETAPRPTEPALSETLYVSGQKVPLRNAPRAGSPILDRLASGQPVTVIERRDGWIRVRHNSTQREGWIQAKRLRAELPAQETKPQESPKIPSGAAALSVAAIAKLLIAESLASYPSSCACPYNTDRANNSCGSRSAYSRPGGYSPLCYASDITPEMVAAYRSRHAGEQSVATRP